MFSSLGAHGGVAQWAPPPGIYNADVSGALPPVPSTARRMRAPSPPPPAASLPPLPRSLPRPLPRLLLLAPPQVPMGGGQVGEALPLPAGPAGGRVVKAGGNRAGSSGGAVGPVFVCPVESCRRQFSKKWNLSAHSRLHTGARPFPCPHCGRRYMWLSSVKSHVRGCGTPASAGRPPVAAPAAAAPAAVAAADAIAATPHPSPAPAPRTPAAWTSPPPRGPVTLPPLRGAPSRAFKHDAVTLLPPATSAATPPLSTPTRTPLPPSAREAPPAVPTKMPAAAAALPVPVVEPLSFPPLSSMSTPPRPVAAPAFCRPPTVLLPPLPGIAAAQSALAAAASPVTPASAASAAAGGGDGGWAASTPPPPPPGGGGGGRPGGCWAALADLRLRRTRAAAAGERGPGASWV